MNSVANVDKVISHFITHGQPSRVELWLDNDEAGEKASNTLKEQLTSVVVDMSLTYSRNNDVNEWHMAYQNQG